MEIIPTEQYSRTREKTKNAIESAALQLFASEGYFSASVSKIALKAGVSKGLMYSYYDNKEALLRAMVGSAVEELNRAIDVPSDAKLVLEDVKRFIKKSINSVEAFPHRWKLFFLVSAQEELLAIAGDIMSQSVVNNSKILSKYFKKKGGKDPQSEQQYFLVCLKGIIQHLVFDENTIDKKAARKLLTKQFC